MGLGNNQTQGTQIQNPLVGKNDGLANLDDFLYDRHNRGQYQSKAINYE